MKVKSMGGCDAHRGAERPDRGERAVAEVHEQQGLLRADRTANGYRDYSESAVSTVANIANLLAAGMNTQRIRDVLPAPECQGAPRTCDDQGGALLARVEAVRDDLRLQAQRTSAHAAALDRHLAKAPGHT